MCQVGAAGLAVSGLRNVACVVDGDARRVQLLDLAEDEVSVRNGM